MRIDSLSPLRRAVLVTALMLGLVVLTGCGRHQDSANAQADAAAADGKDIHINGGITFSGDEVTLRRDDLPTAVITPAGDLVLGGKTVTTTDAQRQAMTAYRKQLQTLTQQGIAVGKAGARLGAEAAGEAIKGIFNGDVDKIGDKVEAQAEQIKQEALKLCTHIEALRVAQDAAVAVVPQFKPYAGIEKSDVQDCNK
ncbi:MAG TPA: DUF2884 family protein [Stenotrophomonas sp.]|nr:DUF2884 family protein [Stenotrophomonas sp.]